MLSADELLGPTFPDLIASGSGPLETPADVGDVLDVSSRAAHARFAELVPDAVHVVHTTSGHEIHLERPELMIEAIELVVASIDTGPRVAPRGG